MKQSDIYLIKWDPSVGHEFRKIRPSIIISNDETIRKNGVITCMPITKTTDSPIREDIHTLSDSLNRLKENSLIKVQHISSFDKARIIKKIGVASEEIMQKIKDYIPKHFDL